MHKKVAIVSTHPIQYNAPFFRLLSREKSLHVKVFYTWGEESIKKFDPGFEKVVEWDIPLLDGYSFCFVKNTASNPGSHHFFGIDNPSLISEIETWAPDAVLVYGWAFKSHLKVLRHFKAKIPVYFRGDSTLLDRETPVKALARQAFLTWVYKHVDVALYAGAESKAYFRKHGLKEEQLRFMPHAVDNQRFSQAAQETQRKHGAFFKKAERSGAVRFLYAGKFTENKNVSHLVHAFQLANLNDAELVLVGNGPQEEKLKAMANGNGQISFLSFQNQAQMPALLSTADVVVLPSKRAETWGLIINEAMACGRAVLASSACGCASDLVQPGRNGQIFKNNDRGDLVRALREMAGNKQSLFGMGTASAEIIRDWSFEKGVSALVCLFDKPK